MAQNKANQTKVESLRRKDRRANIPTEELRDFGRWAFLEISDPWDAKNTIRAFVQNGGG